MKKAIPLAVLCILLTASIAGCLGESNSEPSGSKGASSGGAEPPCCAFEEDSRSEWYDIPVIGWILEQLA